MCLSYMVRLVPALKFYASTHLVYDGVTFLWRQRKWNLPTSQNRLQTITNSREVIITVIIYWMKNG